MSEWSKRLVQCLGHSLWRKVVWVKTVFSEGQNGTSLMCLGRGVITGRDLVTRAIDSNIISI